MLYIHIHLGISGLISPDQEHSGLINSIPTKKSMDAWRQSEKGGGNECVALNGRRVWTEGRER